LKYEMMTLQT